MSYLHVKSREVINTIIAEVGVEDEDCLRKAILAAYPFGERRHWPYKVFMAEVKKTMAGIRLQKTAAPCAIAIRVDMSALIPPAIRYLGSKFLCAEWVISHFPPHRAYCEPCGGSAAVLLNKPRAELETYNDIDGVIVNFFRVVRDHAPELTRRLNLSPWSREEFDRALEPSDDQIESARRLFVRLNMSINGTLRTSAGCRMVKNPDDRKKNNAALEEKLLRIAERLMGVQIEHRDALQVVASYDTPDTLFYVDPPYLMETRKSGRGYTFEADSAWHRQAFEALNAVKGMAIVSGYPSQLYAETYEAAGWRREDRQALTQRGMATESIWISPRIQSLPVQEVLFA